MNKNILIGVGVVIVIILVGWAFYSPRKSEAPTVETPEKATTTTETASNNTSDVKSVGTKDSNSFPAIFTQAGSHECVYEKVTQTSRSRNVIYIADGKMRGEFRGTESSGMSTTNIMVYNSGVLYVWIEGQTTGTKTTLKSVSDLPVVIPRDLTSGAVLGSGINSAGWDCHDWIKNSSLLTPPSYVKF